MPLQDDEREVFAHRLAVGRLGGDGDIKGLAREHQRLARRDRCRKAFAREKGVVDARHILAINRHGEAQRSTGLAAGGVIFYFQFALGIGFRNEMPAIGEVITDGLVGDGLAPIILGFDCQLHRFAAKIH